jgi:tRNA uracil 4-sulfurtransferase
MTLILVRYAEVGLKSERVRKRFIARLVKDMSNRLARAGLDHLIEEERGRIFVDCSDPEAAANILKRVNGVHSFSFVKECGSSKEEIMGCLSEYGKERIEPGMSYGLKVKRTGSHPYTSRDIAVEGGGAVVSHLPEGLNKVDLRHPDIWIEVEIRENRSYLFTDRIPGPGGMPSGTQGRLLLYLPGGPDAEVRDRARLSLWMMSRRGCTVVPVTEDPGPWEGTPGLERPFLLKEGSISKAASALRAQGVAYPYDLLDILQKEGHPKNVPLAEFYPTAGLTPDEVKNWLLKIL